MNPLGKGNYFPQKSLHLPTSPHKHHSYLKALRSRTAFRLYVDVSEERTAQRLFDAEVLTMAFSQNTALRNNAEDSVVHPRTLKPQILQCFLFVLLN